MPTDIYKKIARAIHKIMIIRSYGFFYQGYAKLRQIDAWPVAEPNDKVRFVPVSWSRIESRREGQRSRMIS